VFTESSFLRLCEAVERLADEVTRLRAAFASDRAANDNAGDAAGRRSAERSDWRDTVPTAPEARAAARAAVARHFAKGR
jgi:hypothetical protein